MCVCVCPALSSAEQYLTTSSWHMAHDGTQMNHVFGEDLAGRIPIKTSDREGGCRGHTDGKQKHLASAAEELKSIKKGLEITRNTTLLIDDDGQNITIALDSQVRAIWFNPHEPERYGVCMYVRTYVCMYVCMCVCMRT
jgi:hypothetical protein